MLASWSSLQVWPECKTSPPWVLAILTPPAKLRFWLRPVHTMTILQDAQGSLWSHPAKGLAARSWCGWRGSRKRLGSLRPAGTQHESSPDASSYAQRKLRLGGSCFWAVSDGRSGLCPFFGSSQLVSQFLCLRRKHFHMPISEPNPAGLIPVNLHKLPRHNKEHWTSPLASVAAAASVAAPAAVACHQGIEAWQCE